MRPRRTPACQTETVGGSGGDGLDRFVSAQRDTYDRALAEIRAGRKRTHWMWFVFPQLAGLGRSATAAYYALSGLAEAAAYLAHPVLGPRLVAISRALLDLPAPDPTAVFGYPDDLKLHSCMTLFAQVHGADAVFGAVLAACFAGRPDDATLRLLGGRPPDPALS